MPGRYPLVALVVLDGWGCAPPGPGNAVELADTPVFDDLWRRYPHTTIEASGEAAGLPPGQMGNSEVGHLTIGAGRRLYQDLMRVNKAIEDGSFFENPALLAAFERGRNVHLLGLVSHGGVHSHIDHLQALLRFAPEKTWIHAFTDGRDVSPTSAVADLAELPADRIATVSGRYYAMDRDGRWERTQRAFDAIVKGEGEHADDPIEAIRRSYERGVTDEFVEPVVLDGRPRLEPGDTAIFFNFRPDRARQLTQRLLEAGFDVTTMTRYRDDLDTPVAFEERDVPETLAEVLASHGVRQLHAAETEKYAHVTYFLDGGREEPFTGEERILVDSPRDVPSYDHKPEMSGPEVAERPRLDPARDSAVFFNFRPDRARQLTRKLVEAGTDLTTMTRYAADIDVPVAFGERAVHETLAEVLAEHHVRQLHVAETEKYAHVTYFFNGGREAEWGGETRVLVPSPRDVPSYDYKPENAEELLSQPEVDGALVGGASLEVESFTAICEAAARLSRS